MLMEIHLSEDKGKKNNIDIEEYYQNTNATVRYKLVFKSCRSMVY